MTKISAQGGNILQELGDGLYVNPSVYRDTSIIHSGATMPLAAAWTEGDYFILTTNKKLYKKVSGAWQELISLGGDTGLSGSPGRTIRYGGAIPNDGVGEDGDMYINTLNKGMYVRENGEYTLMFYIDSTAGSGTSRFEFTKVSPATEWVINHNLGHKPSVSVFTSGGVEIEANVQHYTTNQTRVTFNTPMAGTAICV